METVLGAAFIIILAWIYFLPTICARHHPASMGIFVVNLFFGWTLLGWVLALAWALNGQGRKRADPAERAPGAPSRTRALSEIERLAALREKGHLSEAEFAAAKSRLLTR